MDIDDFDTDMKINDDIGSRTAREQLPQDDTHLMMEEQDEDTIIRAEINKNLKNLDSLRPPKERRIIEEDILEESSSCHQGDNEGTHPAILQSPKKSLGMLDLQSGFTGRPRERSTSHCFGAEEIK